MAKRRKLEAPTAEDLDKIEAEFRRETPENVPKAPIAHVVAESAEQSQAGTGDNRRDEAQAAAYRDAEEQGRLIREIDLADIAGSALQRDRTQMDDEALTELEHSIEAHGLRLPIEVYVLKSPQAGKRYGLLSGYRRLIAQRNLFARTSDPRFARIKAVQRDPDKMGGAFVAMVEENEVRQDLSHYERGRIAVIAVQQGAFENVEEAVSAMFAAASKAKRSKVRSFARIFEDLGDVLNFPESLREKEGLRLAQALRNGAADSLRDILGAETAESARIEAQLIESALARQQPPADSRNGGRPRKAQSAPDIKSDRVQTATGMTIEAVSEDEGYVIRLSGHKLDLESLNQAVNAVLRVLDKA